MKVVTGYTTVDGQPPGHAHAFQIDENGNGYTKGQIGSGEGVAPHTHDIVNRKVKPAGSDNHTHRLAKGHPGQIEE